MEGINIIFLYNLSSNGINYMTQVTLKSTKSSTSIFGAKFRPLKIKIPKLFEE
jgi:hypothetical protein